MKLKDIKNYAKRIAEAEYVIQTSDDAELVEKAKENIMIITDKVHSLDDLLRIEEYTAAILEKILTK